MLKIKHIALIFFIIVGMYSETIVTYDYQYAQTRTSSYGGNGGKVFEWAARESDYEVREIRIRAGSRIDQLTLVLNNGNTNLLSPTRGGSGGKYYSWQVPDDQYISQVIVRAGSRTDSLQFITNKGNRSPKYGGNGGQEYTISFTNDYKMIGFFGRSGAQIDKIGFITQKTIQIPVFTEVDDEDVEQGDIVIGSDDCGELCVLPAYMGSGYDILKGNPDNEDSFDPGFRSRIFQYTYEEQQTTEDGKYLVPDDIDSRLTQTCSLSATTSTFYGTKSYQKSLQTKVDVAGGYDGSLTQAAFSASLSYEHVKESTIEQENIMSHAQSQCEAYRLTLGSFSFSNIEENFVLGVQQSFASSNWTRFINQFGTHYVFDIIFGGRAIQRKQYSRQSVSTLQSQDISIEAAASFSYAQVHGDLAFDYDSSQSDAQYADNVAESSEEIYIGGQPSASGTLDGWRSAVKNNPMPIYYRMSLISDLFDKVLESDEDVATAKTQFNAGLVTYCESLNCSGNFVDLDLPTAQFNYSTVAANGGGGGKQFNWLPTRLTHSFTRVSEVQLRSGNEIDFIRLKMTDGVQVEYTGDYGGSGGSYKIWLVPTGEYITQIVIRTGNRVDALQFITNAGNKSPYYGGNGGQKKTLTVPKGYQIIGIFGRSGSRLDRLGFNVGKVTYTD